MTYFKMFMNIFYLLAFFSQQWGLTLALNFQCSDVNSMHSNNQEVSSRLRALEEQMLQVQSLLQGGTRPSYTTVQGYPEDCEEIYKNGTRVDGIYAISPDGRCPFFVHCDMTNGGWTVIQRRINGNVNFFRDWDDYVHGFGDVDGEFWLGLQKIHRLTQGGSQIYFGITNYDDTTDFAHYQTFTVHGAATKYRMNVDAYGYQGSINELFTFHDNMVFSTYDRDNDVHATANCCADHGGGGWWWKNCYKLGNVNGIYGKMTSGGLGYWNSKYVPIKGVELKVKAINGTC
ncbi:TENN-like protein [Mya arenaria]|uniref:TENN-like protein n=1 Tax=Mya arenaria TaxID=6604 RepID=A0ABY7F108_MYAAR|nr:microfibril-associated glycoprotein 4-like [Mya arenaria]WAR15877.1 TENN-like protein [Mya arenaria]